MSKWDTVKMGVLTKIRTGKLDANASTENGIYPFFTCSVTPLKIDSYSYECECVLVAGNGDLNVKYYNGKFDAYQRTYIIESEVPERLFVPYLFRFLEKYIEVLRLQSTGGVIKYIRLGNLTEANIPLPSLDEQRRIAQTLDAAAELLRLRKQQLADLDALVKSRFIEMFGDPVVNEKHWGAKVVSDFADVKIGPFGSLLHVEDYVENGYPLINPSHISNGTLAPDKKFTISFEKYSDLRPYQMQKHDIVIGRRGEIGRCAIVHENGFLCGTGSMFIRIRDCCTPDYLQRIISFPTFKAQLEDKAVGVTMKNLNAGTIANSTIPLPPLSLQTQFADFVQKVEDSKALVQQSIDETQALFDSLMSEYFD